MNAGGLGEVLGGPHREYSQEKDCSHTVPRVLL